ncbi:MAG: hypothetical protein JXB49_19715 [Bacteroidales bacterium]|nr:hypothetical protein [Bacteroidales bacterium]
MKYKLEKLTHLSGEEASIYGIYLYDEKKTLFEIFFLENKNLYLSELKQLFQRLKTIGYKTGAREQYFKMHEGKPGDHICALYDEKKKLRLYCIRFGSVLLLLGGGGPKTTRAFQDNEKLMYENYLLRKIANDIARRLSDGEIEFSDDGYELTGNLEFNCDDK